MSQIIGIDLGGSNTRFSVPETSGNAVMVANASGELKTRSVVYLGDDGPIVGTEAYNLLLADPSRGIRHWKRYIGRNKSLATVNGIKYTAQDVARILIAYVLKAVEQKTGQMPTDAVIAVPANFTDSQRQQILNAAHDTGIQNVSLVSEPAAALVGNGVHKKADGTYMVIDPGGTTLDVSVATKDGDSLTILRTDGEPQLGGQDFTARLEKIALDRFEAQHKFRPDENSDPLAMQDLAQRAEQAKITLSIKDQASIVVSSAGKVTNVTITRAEFEQATSDLIDKSMDCGERTLKEAGTKAADLQGIYLVGGPSAMPAMIQAVEKRFGSKPLSQCEPHFATALGAANQARIEVERQGRRVQVGNITLPPIKLILQEVTAHAIGVAVLRDAKDFINAVLIPSGTRIPSEFTQSFKLHEKGQVDAYIEILQGPDGAPQDQCLVIGHFELTGMTPVMDDTHTITLTFKIDRNGLLTATAVDPLSGAKAELILDYKNPVQPPPGK
ncbi:MAG: Hsp70 family protein [Phycisphaerae bacterium]